MPQAPSHLMHLSEMKCHEILHSNFGEHKGHYYPRIPGYKPNKEEEDAILYMITEWDYGYSDTRPD